MEKENKYLVRRAWVEAKRKFHSERLHRLYLPFYEALIKELDKSEQGKFWAPYDSVRTLEKQRTLYEIGRDRPGRIVTNARPGFSAHNWGCASDWAEFHPDFNGTDAWDKARWNYYSQCVRKVGLQWGGDWNGDGIRQKIDFDFPHNNLLIKVSWKKVGEFFEANDEIATINHIGSLKV